MKILSFSTNDELEIAEFIAKVGGLDRPTSEQLWTIASCLDWDSMNVELEEEE